MLLEVLDNPRHARAAGGVVVELPYTGAQRLEGSGFRVTHSIMGGFRA